MQFSNKKTDLNLFRYQKTFMTEKSGKTFQITQFAKLLYNLSYFSLKDMKSPGHFVPGYVVSRTYNVYLQSLGRLSQQQIIIWIYMGQIVFGIYCLEAYYCLLGELSSGTLSRVEFLGTDCLGTDCLGAACPSTNKLWGKIKRHPKQLIFLTLTTIGLCMWPLWFLSSSETNLNKQS